MVLHDKMVVSGKSKSKQRESVSTDSVPIMYRTISVLIYVVKIGNRFMEWIIIVNTVLLVRNASRLFVQFLTCTSGG